MKQQILCTIIGALWMNYAFAQPIINVRGSEDSLTTIAQVAQYLDHLDIREKVYLMVYFTSHMPKKLQGITFCLNYPASDTYQIIKVRIDSRLNKRLQQIVLAHEMIHVKQYAKRELIVVDDHQVLWKGRRYAYQRDANRQLAPWEHEAYRTDGQLAQLCRELPLTASRTER